MPRPTRIYRPRELLSTESASGVEDGDNVDWPTAPAGNTAPSYDQWKLPVRAATTADIDIDADAEDGDTIDGVVLDAGDRLLIKEQTAQEQNGIYIVQASGRPERAADMDNDGEVLGAHVYVVEGTANGGTIFYCDLTAEPVIDTDAITFTEVSTAGGPLSNYTATTDPTTGDDDGDGYEVGSRWVNTTSGEEFVCVDASTGAAVWTSTTDAGAFSGDAGDIPITDAGGYFTGTDVEAALQELGAGGGGSGSSVPYLDQATLDGTYGDDFVDNALDAKWTLLNLTTGGVMGGQDDGSHAIMGIGTDNTLHAQSIYQTGPNDDEFTVVASGHIYSFAANHIIGPYIVSSTGTGVGGAFRSNTNNYELVNLTSYAYASQLATRGSMSTNAAALGSLGQRMWWRLRKSLGVYLFDWSLNGISWAPAVTAVPTSFTPAKIGFGRMFQGTEAVMEIHLDRFNVLDVLSYGSNLVSTPSSGTATYTANTSFSGSFLPGNAADGNAGTDWATTNGSTAWWQVAWSVGQTLNRVRVWNRLASHLGGVYAELSDGVTTTRVPLGYVDNVSAPAWYVASFPDLTGITTLKIAAIATAGIGVAGFIEAEAYLAS